jgi:hypothetical protein
MLLKVCRSDDNASTNFRPLATLLRNFDYGTLKNGAIAGLAERSQI